MYKMTNICRLGALLSLLLLPILPARSQNFEPKANPCPVPVGQKGPVLPKADNGRIRKLPSKIAIARNMNDLRC